MTRLAGRELLLDMALTRVLAAVHDLLETRQDGAPLVAFTPVGDWSAFEVWAEMDAAVYSARRVQGRPDA